MNRRWQSDGIPFWRKLFSSNWWWYGEVNPDPVSLPPPESRPKFWRGDMIFLSSVLLGMPTLAFITNEVNARYWFFNQTATYVGRIADVRYTYPQFRLELQDKTVVLIGLPMNEAFGLPGKRRPVERWMPIMNRITSRQYDCPNRLLAFEAQPLFSFRPFLNAWEVRCASGPVLITSKEIIQVWNNFKFKSDALLFGTCVLILFFFVFLVIRRERKLYVKS